VVVCADTTVSGVDVSRYQVGTDWSKVAASGRAFAFIKYSEALDYTSSSFAADWAGAKAAGILRGAYHFFHPDQDGTAQAQFFLQHVAHFGAGELPPVIDVETGTDMDLIGRGVSAWVDAVVSATGKRPLVYVSSGFWRVPASYGIEGRADLWVAQYPGAQPPAGGPWCPNVTGAWTTWKFWQHSDKGQVPGVQGGCDVDVFNGSLDELRAYAGQGAGSIVRAPIAAFRAVEARVARLPAYARYGALAGMVVLLALLGYAVYDALAEDPA
jgi:lysozyme